jgi:endonuclease/exonuclease/phosphatase family metal-dependent hydrolase
MTFNIFNTIPDDEVEFFSDLWANRSAFNAKTIKRYDPDLIGFQEFEPVHRATYQETLPEYAYYISNESGEGTAIFWKTARFERIEAGDLWLPRTMLPPTLALEDEILMNSTWVKLRCRQNGQEFIHLNTHLNDASEEARQAGMALNLQQVAQVDGRRTLPVIITGDFNCNPWSPVYNQLLSEGFVDSYRAAGHGDGVESSTFHGFHGASYFALDWGDQVYWRVDWIMLHGGQSAWQTTSCTIVRDAEPPVFASDHYPVVTEVLVVG